MALELEKRHNIVKKEKKNTHIILYSKSEFN